MFTIFKFEGKKTLTNLGGGLLYRSISSKVNIYLQGDTIGWPDKYLQTHMPKKIDIKRFIDRRGQIER